MTVAKQCRGVELLIGGQRQSLNCRREVILSAGTFNSPQLLLLSGIGPAEHLASHGIAVVHELPGVGQNLVDHPDFVTSYRALLRDVLGASPIGIWHLLRDAWRFSRGNPNSLMSTNGAEAGGFLKTDPSLDRPDIQLHFVVGILQNHARSLSPYHGVSCHACVLRPTSRGWVQLASANPLDAPLIHPNFLATEADVAALLRGVRLMQRIMAAAPLGQYAATEMQPTHALTDAQLIAEIRRRADTVYHPVGTCRMGQDRLAVVDAQLRVQGMTGLRVVDASVMPTLIGGNTSAPTIMIAEKAADLIKASYAN